MAPPLGELSPPAAEGVSLKGVQGVLVPSGHRPGPTDAAAETRGWAPLIQSKEAVLAEGVPSKENPWPLALMERQTKRKRLERGHPYAWT